MGDWTDITTAKGVLTIVVGFFIGVIVQIKRKKIWPALAKRVKEVNPLPSNTGKISFFSLLQLAAIASCISLILIATNTSFIATSSLATIINYSLYILLGILIVSFLLHIPFFALQINVQNPIKGVLVIIHTVLLTFIFCLIIKLMFSNYVLLKRFTIAEGQGFSFWQNVFIIIFLALNVLVLTNYRYYLVKDHGLRYLSLPILCCFTAFVFYMPVKQRVAKGDVINNFFKNDKQLNNMYDSLQRRE